MCLRIHDISFPPRLGGPCLHLPAPLPAESTALDKSSARIQCLLNECVVIESSTQESAEAGRIFGELQVLAFVY